MLIGVPKEIKNHEYRVGLTPEGVRELTAAGHQVAVEENAGAAIGLTNDHYRQAGASVLSSVEELFATAELIVKVKEPQPEEAQRLKPDQILFAFLHLAPDLRQAELLAASGAACIAYETVTDSAGGLPLLNPMSELAGRLSIQAAARCLEKACGGSGVLMGGVPGVEPAQVVIIGGGTVGLNAARMAMGLGAKVTVLDRSLPRLRMIDELYGDRLTTLFSTREALEKQLRTADAVIGAVLIPGAAAPKLVSREMLNLMKPGSVMVDVAIDQGGCFATSRPTTHSDPTYVVDGIVHYCVANMPGAVAQTSTYALTNATLPFVAALANKGRAALLDNPHLMNGLNVYQGKITCEAVAQALSQPFVPAHTALAASRPG